MLCEKIIKKLQKIYYSFYPETQFVRQYWSQDGEDTILADLFTKTGFYVDVGAYHPFRFSNTYSFYKKGWSGINIDAMPGSMRLFNKYRPRDINIECPCGNDLSPITYYSFRDPALNCSSSERAESLIKNGWEFIGKYQLQPRRLADILDEHANRFEKIDFMSIDVETMEQSVLDSNNWERYRPEYIFLEILDEAKESFSDILQDSLCQYLDALDYFPQYRVYRTVVFHDKRIKS